MPFDGLVLAATRKELTHKLTGGRIERIYQPDKLEMIILIHKPGERHRLLLAAGAQNARVHLSTATRENPVSPPLFCMVLRKHLEGGRIAGFNQPGLERVLAIKISVRDELGLPSEKHLICEIMGKHSNIILLDHSTNTIIDGIKRYSHHLSRFREVLPGRQYLPPPKQNKLNPLLLNEEEFRRACLDLPLQTPLPKLLQKRFEGLSTVTCQEIVYRANLRPETILDQCGDYEFRMLWESLQAISVPAAKGQFEPCLLAGKKGEFLDFAALDLSHTGTNRKYGEMNSLLDIFFSARENLERLNQAKGATATLLKKEIARRERKLDIYAENLDDTAGAEKLRLYGELLTANLYRLGKGQSEVTLENYYEEHCPSINIPLDPQRTPAENSQAYFKKYAKAKRTRRILEARAAQLRNELDYLEGIKSALDYTSDMAGMTEIKKELIGQGYLKQPVHRPGAVKSKKEKQVPKPSSCYSTDGFQIFVGKNNRQNDHLTMKMAGENDIWLHVKDIPGAHVIVKTEGKETPSTTLVEAAGLAAFFSKARKSKNVPVDYTLKKYVRKPKGARPGMVIYERQKTIMVSPDENMAERLEVLGKSN